jgi:cell division protein YceG involved in septum cleavage
VICLALLAGTFLYNIFYSTPGAGALPAEVRIEQGDSFATVARKLRAQNIISNAIFFSLWARVVGSDKKIHQGLYRFTDEVSPQGSLGAAGHG